MVKDKDIEIILGNLLRWGVLVSSLVVFTGGLIYLIRHGYSFPDYHNFMGRSHPFHTLKAVINGLREGRGQAFIQTGIILLIATPIARVIFSIAGFFLEKDKQYVLIASLVLIIILISILLGLEG